VGFLATHVPEAAVSRVCVRACRRSLLSLEHALAVAGFIVRPRTLLRNKPLSFKILMFGNAGADVHVRIYHQ
jgi:hypothetical protein